MTLKIIRDNIVNMKCDAIVNAANSSLLGGGGVDGAIHKAAGRELYDACLKLGGCKIGQAKMTLGYQLPAKYIIHTVGPIYKDGKHHEKELLESCYRESLKIALDNKLQSIAFPLISSGIYGYPKAEALHIAVSCISEFLLKNEMDVYLVIFDKDVYQISQKLFKDIQSYIDDHYVEEMAYLQSQRLKQQMIDEDFGIPCSAVFDESDFEKMFDILDESFTEMLLRKIGEKGMSDSECYKKANIDRKLFSKIRSNVHYKPSKITAICFAIALELSLDETNELLLKAGFALSHSDKFDVIIEYFIKNQNYNIFEINEVLFAFDQRLLGN